MNQARLTAYLLALTAPLVFTACEESPAGSNPTANAGGASLYAIWFAVGATLDEEGMDYREKGYSKVALCLNSKIVTVDIVLGEMEVDEENNRYQVDFTDPDVENAKPSTRVIADYEIDADFLNITYAKKWDLDASGEVIDATLEEGPGKKYERKEPREACTVGQ